MKRFMLSNSRFLICLFLASLSLAMGCSSSRASKNDNGPDKITSIHLIDRNGLSETVSTKERLKQYQQADFLKAQPYQKVTRVYGRDSNGDSRTYITSYHLNGQLSQYMEALNARAYGKYREWHQNGNPKLEANVIGGIADLGAAAEEKKFTSGQDEARVKD